MALFYRYTIACNLVKNSFVLQFHVFPYIHVIIYIYIHLWPFSNLSFLYAIPYVLSFDWILFCKNGVAFTFT